MLVKSKRWFKLILNKDVLGAEEFLDFHFIHGRYFFS